VRIHRITIKDFRGVAERTVEFPETGVTVIEGENEVGKSSLVDALFLLIDYADSSTDSHVRSVRPVHTGRNPVVSAELSCGAYRFVYEKCYSSRGSERHTTLAIVQPRREQLTGTEAHERVVRILAETTDETLWRALRLQQGLEVKQKQLPSDSSLGAALDAASGSAQGGDRENNLFERVTTENGLYFTKTGQDKDMLKAPRENALKAAISVTELQRQVADLERDTERCDSLTAELAHLRPQETEQRDLVATLEAQWNKVIEQKHELEQLRLASDLATNQYDAARDALFRRNEAITALQRLQDEVSRLSEERERLMPAAEAGRQEVEAAEHELATRRDLLTAAQAAHRLRSDDEIYVRDCGELERMRERLKNVEEAQPVIDDCEAFLGQCRIDEESLEGLDATTNAVIRARARLEAAAPAVRVEALTDVVVGTGGEARQLAAGEVLGLSGSTRLQLRIGDLAAVTITAGGDASQLQDEWTAASSDLQQLADALAVTDLRDAQSQFRRRQQAAERLAAARKLIGQNLRDRTSEELRGMVQRTQARVTEYSASRSAELPLPANLDEARRIRDAASRNVDLCQEAVASAEKGLTDLRNRTEQLTRDSQRAGTLVDAGVEQLAETQESLAAARAQAPDESLQTAVTDRKAQSGEAEGRHGDALARLQQAAPETLEIRLANARTVLDRSQSDIRHREDEHRELRATLRLRGEEGLAGRFESARSEAEHLHQISEAVARRAAAAKLLFVTMSAHRQKAREAYIEPFRAKLEGLGKIVFGNSFSVELSEDLQVANRTLNGVTVDYASLSTGAKEQIGVLSRLACASLVSAQGGVPLILDDALGWSDPRRLERLGAAFTSSAQDCQVIVLTCTPDRYRHVGSAKVVRLS
jgi:uncharacterized protein YhaN